MISSRASFLFDDAPPIIKGHVICAKNAYNKENNASGYINLGVAENSLMDKSLCLKFEQLNSSKMFGFHYDFPQGGVSVRNKYNNFLKHFFNINDLPIENITFASGASAILEMLTFTLCEEGDEVLILAPLYNGFYHDLEPRFKAKVVAVDCFIDGEFDHNSFEAAIDKNNIKLVIINNPHNPTGLCLRQNDIKAIIKTAKLNELDIVADEIYGNSVYGERDFISFLNPIFDDLNYQESIHHVYGMAKDFCTSGLKVGVYAGHNEKVSHAMAGLSYFHTVSTQTQFLAQEIFDDLEWCDNHFKTNRKLLKDVSTHLLKEFKKLGIKVFPASAGIFLWIDLSTIFNIRTNEDELYTYNRLLNNAKVNLSPGQFFAADKPGMFRVCFAKPLDTIDEFFVRLNELINNES